MQRSRKVSRFAGNWSCDCNQRGLLLFCRWRDDLAGIPGCSIRWSHCSLSSVTLMAEDFFLFTPWTLPFLLPLNTWFTAMFFVHGVNSVNDWTFWCNYYLLIWNVRCRFRGCFTTSYAWLTCEAFLEAFIHIISQLKTFNSAAYLAKFSLIFSVFGRALRGLVRLYRTKSGQNLSHNAIYEAFMWLIFWNFLNFFSF